MNQLSMFEFISEDIQMLYSHGALYALVPEELIKVEPVELGDETMLPGQFTSQLGEKKRTSFQMQEGKLLRYCGKAEDLILFSVNDTVSNYFYAFYYIDKNTLLIGSEKGMRDIRIKKLDIRGDVK